MVVIAFFGDRRGEVEGRRWAILQNDYYLFSKYALKPDLFQTACWKSLLWVWEDVYDLFLFVIGSFLIYQRTKLHNPTEPKKLFASFLIYCGQCACAQVASQRRLDSNTVHVYAKEGSRFVCELLLKKLLFRTTASDVRESMVGFRIYKTPT